uniref:Glycosyl transferase, group 1 n=1 Tax=Dechloromonas aromatica (strain RCB) TaxID=159087 RepID=Q47DC9_DECAR
MKIALLCSGLGIINRGHEVFARDIFNTLKGHVDITLFKGGGETDTAEIVVDNIGRNSDFLSEMKISASPRWESAVREEERMRIEGLTFAYAALKHLLIGDFNVIHCLEQEVCNVIYENRHLFRHTPKILWSNGGALPKSAQPKCDFVQEHTEYNLQRSNRSKAFMIPHGVDLKRFHPGLQTDFRERHGIPEDAFVVISVGTICYWHKRMDYVIREVAAVPDAWLVIVGQESGDSPAIKALGRELMGERIVFTTMPHDELPKAYAAADVFTLGSLFETFGIVYIEAMAMGLPVISTNHPNQKSIIKDGIFVDMTQPAALAAVLQQRDARTYAELGKIGVETAKRFYDIKVLRQRYLDTYARLAATPVSLPRYSFSARLNSNIRNLLKRMRLV